MSLEYVLNPGGSGGLSEKTLTEEDIRDHDVTKVHTGLSDARVTTKLDRSLDAYAKRQYRVNLKIDGSVEWAGYIFDTDHSETAATTTIELDGIAKRLEETRPDYENIGGSVVYNNIALHDAIRDYWGRTPFNNVTVTDESTETVATDTEVQAADTQTEWENIATGIPDTTPVGVKNGELTALQTCFVHEGESPDTTGIFTTSKPEYSGGVAGHLEGAPSEETYRFTPEYTIPQENVAGMVRNEVEDNGRDTDNVIIKLNGQKIYQVSGTRSSDLEWDNLEDFAEYSNGDLQAGQQYEITVEALSSASFPEDFEVDVIAVYDNRFNYTFDNDNGGSSGYLDGPQLYPDGATAETDVASASFNISAVNLDSTWDDTTGAQQIEATLDGSTYVSGSNTQTLDKTFSNQVGRSINIRYTFDRYGSRTTATPQTGFNGQSIDSVSVKVDGDNLSVIDTLELSRDHFSNLQTLHNFGNFLWVIEHDSSDIANMTVSSFAEGDETRSSPPEFDDPANQNSRVAAQNYYNSIYIQGAEDSNGDRPSAEAKDQTAINNDPREISPGVLRDPDITTEDGALFKARSILSTATSNNDLVGSVTVPPVSGLTNPGYARKIDFGDGENFKTVESISYSESTGNVTATYEFTLPNDLANRISSLQRGQRQIGDQV